MNWATVAVFLTVTWIVAIGALHTAGIIDVATRDEAFDILLYGGSGSALTVAVMKARSGSAPPGGDQGP